MSHQAKRAKTSFQLTWQSAYGLEVAERHPGTREVQSAQCLFCKFFGRQPLKVHPQKSKPTEKVHFYTPPGAQTWSRMSTVTLPGWDTCRSSIRVS